MELKIGGIYRLDRTRFYSGYGDKEMLVFTKRVICFDQYEVISDFMPPSESDWEMNKKQKNLFWFVKSSMRTFDEDAVEIGSEEFSKDLVDYYKTNLILRISRIRDVSWNDELFNAGGLLAEYVKRTQSEVWINQRIESPQLYLMPCGNSGGFKTPVLVEADNKEFFTSTEVLWKASQLQRKHYTTTSTGVGVFRSGTKNGIPVYYMGEYLGGGKYLKEYEESGVDTNV